MERRSDTHTVRYWLVEVRHGTVYMIEKKAEGDYILYEYSLAFSVFAYLMLPFLRSRIGR